MLMVGSQLLNFPVLSLHVGGAVAQTKRAIIDPDDLKIMAYTLDGPALKNDPEIGDILDLNDVREVSNQGLIVDSTDVFAFRDEMVKLDEIIELDFDLIGLKVFDENKKHIGKVVDYTLDTGTFMVYQLIVQRPIMASFIDPQLTINRSQIVEIDDFKITIKNGKSEVKVKSDKNDAQEDFVPNFVNPFRKPSHAVNEDYEDNSSKTSE